MEKIIILEVKKYQIILHRDKINCGSIGYSLKCSKQLVTFQTDCTKHCYRHITKFRKVKGFDILCTLAAKYAFYTLAVEFMAVKFTQLHWSSCCTLTVEFMLHLTVEFMLHMHCGVHAGYGLWSLLKDPVVFLASHYLQNTSWKGVNLESVWSFSQLLLNLDVTLVNKHTGSCIFKDAPPSLLFFLVWDSSLKRGWPNGIKG